MAEKVKPGRKQTVRERAEASSIVRKPRRIKKAATSAASPIKSVRSGIKREVHIFRYPENKKFGKFLNRKARFFPKFFSEAWKELRLVEWPNRRTSWKSTFAVVVFAVVFGLIIAITDYGLDQLFKNVLIK